VSYVAVDLECDGLVEKGKAPNIWMVGYYEAEDSWDILDLREPRQRELIQELLLDNVPIFHNASYDVAVLRAHGFEVPTFHDTLVLSYSWETGADHSLEAWGVKLGYPKMDYRQALIDEGYIDKKLKKGEEFKRLYDWDLMSRYCLRDCEITLKVWDHLSTLMQEKDPRAWKLYLNVEMPYVEVVMELESTGVYIDMERCLSLSSRLEDAKQRVTERIHRIVPWKKTKPTEYKKGYYKRNEEVVYNHCKLEPFNPNSGDQVAEALTELYGWEPTVFTDSGKPKTSADILMDLSNPLAQNLAAYSRMATITDTFITAFTERSDDNHILYGHFNQCITRTGRLSSSGPNLQNLPRRGRLGALVRSLVTTPDAGSHVLFDGDLSNIEARMLAYYLEHYQGDGSMAQAFRDSTDFHTVNAQVWGVSRDAAKTILYGILYGAGPAKVAGIMGCTTKEAGELIASLPVTALKDKVWTYARNHGGVIHTLMGRRLVYKGLNAKDNELKSKAERQVFNALLQGGAGDILKELTLRSLDTIHLVGARLALAVHDELVGYCHPSVAQDLCTSLTALFGECELLETVPVVAEFQYGTNWNELH
jgi:DNA polymerase I-like protein with 3'-5' exonuclease and polymerase domains